MKARHGNSVGIGEAQGNFLAENLLSRWLA